MPLSNPIMGLRSLAGQIGRWKGISPSWTRQASTIDASSEGIPAVQADQQLRLSAIKLYKEVQTPNLVIVNTDHSSIVSVVISEEIILDHNSALRLIQSPDPNYEFNKRLRRIFESEFGFAFENVQCLMTENSKLTSADEVKKQLEMGEHVKKGTFRLVSLDHADSLEILAMLALKKFRHLRRAYHPNEGPR